MLGWPKQGSWQTCTHQLQGLGKAAKLLATPSTSKPVIRTISPQPMT